MIWSLKETLPREEIREIQFKRLKKTLKHVYKNVPYYRNLFKANKIKPDDIRSLRTCVSCLLPPRRIYG